MLGELSHDPKAPPNLNVSRRLHVNKFTSGCHCSACQWPSADVARLLALYLHSITFFGKHIFPIESTLMRLLPLGREGASAGGVHHAGVQCVHAGRWPGGGKVVFEFNGPTRPSRPTVA
jgi:hypothetical protein